MIKRWRQISLGFLVVATAWLVSAAPVYAVESFGVGARPAHPRADNSRTQSIFVYDLTPGARVNDGVIVANNTQQQKIVKVYSVDSQVSSDGAFACAQEADVKTAVGSWISLENSEVTVDPGKQVTVPFSINVPKSANVGEQDGCIAVQATDAVSPKDQNGISLSFRSALRVAITVPGDLKSQLAATTLTHQTLNDTLIVTPSFRNTGNVSLDSRIVTRINSFFGLPVQSVDGTYLVLREATGTFNFEMNRPFWGGYYTLTSHASYKALSSAAKAGETKEISQLIFIAPHPMALLIEAIIAIAIIGAIVILILRKKRHREHLQFSRHHSIKPGENIQSIGDNYGVSWKLVARVNGLRAPYTLTPETKILIPNTTRKLRKKK